MVPALVTAEGSVFPLPSVSVTRLPESGQEPGVAVDKICAWQLATPPSVKLGHGDTIPLAWSSSRFALFVGLLVESDWLWSRGSREQTGVVITPGKPTSRSSG